MRPDTIVSFLGVDQIGPIGMDQNPYIEGSKEWNTFVDFACMPKPTFTLKEASEYHGVEIEFYTFETLERLAKDGLLLMGVSK